MAYENDIDLYQKVAETVEEQRSLHVKHHREALKQKRELYEYKDTLFPNLNFILVDDEVDYRLYVCPNTRVGGQIILYLPWNDITDTIRLLFEECGWQENHFFDWKEDSGQYLWKYSHPRLPDWDVKIYADMSNEGSTCELVQVGETVETRPVYEVRCKEAMPWE